MSLNRIATSALFNYRFLLSLVAATIQLGMASPVFAEETKAAPEASAVPLSNASSTATSPIQQEKQIEPADSNGDYAPLHDSEKTMDPWKVNEACAAKLKQSIEKCNKRLSKDPNDIDALIDRSTANLHIGTARQVIDDVQKVFSLKPKEKSSLNSAYCNRGEARLRLKEYKLALEDLNKALEADTNADNGEVYFFRGMAQEKLGMLALAMDDYAKAKTEGFSPKSDPVPPDYGPYMNEVQRRIKRCWFPPRGEESKRITVIFKINREGKVLELAIEKSSSSPVADAESLRAVHNAEPFARLPDGGKNVVSIRFTFDYNVFGKGRAPLNREEAMAQVKQYKESYSIELQSGNIRKQKQLLTSIGALEVDLGKYDSALTCYRTAQALIANTGNDKIENIKILNLFALAFAAQGRKAEAEAKFKESIVLANQVNKPVFLPGLKHIYLDYADFLHRNHRSAEAKKYYDYFNSKK